MRRFDAEELATRMGAENHAPGAVIEGFATDSRDVAPGDLFLAFRGERVEGHEYVAQALARGAAAALVERTIEGPHLLVAHVVDALARFGRSLRDEFKGPVVGLTGSAGKTTTKEMLAAALSPLGEIVKTAGNRNSEYTSPLLWAEVEPMTKAVVVEMAMRGFGQIDHLARIAAPTLGLITNVGHSHLLQVGSREGIAKAKGELLEALPWDAPCLLPADDEYLPQLRRTAGNRPILTFGFADEADARIIGYRPIDFARSALDVRVSGENLSITLPAAGRHLAKNASAAILAACVLGVPRQKVEAAISNVVLPPMRMQTISRKGATILLDAYNAAPNSVLAALETLVETPVDGRRLAVVGEMRELGDAAEDLHREIGRATAKLDDVLFIGETAEWMREASGRGRTGTIEDARRFLDGLQPGDVALVKGSRSLGLERVLD